MKVRFLRDMFSLSESCKATDLTLGRVYNVLGCSPDGTVAIHDDVGEGSELYRGEYEVVEEEDIHL